MPLGDSQALPKIHTMFLGKAKAGENVQVKAAALLITSGALVELSAADAREVVGYMRPELVKAGQVVIREGESTRNDFMALVLDGEVTVENSVAAAHDSMVVSVLGPGGLIGDMGIIDGGRARPPVPRRPIWRWPCSRATR